ncbi:hypothetical protein PR202_ga29524 [Eleusine coracana subsp. coracana]|uniref:NAC domain-containing protein n=1 Tax=Eleusine coracana subsp. coracana TaxID=191504 RepID=A0AAV5DLM9_ELECO|nr:hypothetical protein PR202_ga29524 [Eleusine coracana subsp. coracana]
MRSMESTDSSSGSAPPQRKQPGPAPHLPPGFRFHPNGRGAGGPLPQEEAASMPLPVTIIAEVDLYKFDPWELPEKANFGEHEWYFFSPRDRKYPNGARAEPRGDVRVLEGHRHRQADHGVRRRPREGRREERRSSSTAASRPRVLKTNWIMHEYRLTDATAASSTNTSCRPPPGSGGVGKAAASLRLDDWVLCRIYKKVNKQLGLGDHHQQQRSITECEGSVEDAVAAPYHHPSHAVPAGGNNYTSRCSTTTTTSWTALLTTVEDGGAGSLSQLAAVARASPAVVTKQLFAPASATPFNWLDASSAIAILPPAKRYHGFGRDNKHRRRHHVPAVVAGGEEPGRRSWLRRFH